MKSFFQKWRRKTVAKPAADERPPIYIHAGLHKTGTSALQTALYSNAERLRSAGLLYPSAGIPKDSHGHHNLAWEIVRDRRYRASFGRVDDVAQEIASHGGPAILSSEDFETILDRPEQFSTFINHPMLARHRFVLIVYLREQSSYFRSLFLELTRHGLTEEMARLAEAVGKHGFFDLKEWRFQFDYHRIATRLAAWRGGSLVLRNFHGVTGGSTVTDFLELVCPGFFLSEVDSVRFVHTERPLAEAMAAFFEARFEYPLNNRQLKAIAAVSNVDVAPTVALSIALQTRLQAAFTMSNYKLVNTMGLSLKAIDYNADIERSRLELDSLFSFEMQNLLAALDDH